MTPKEKAQQLVDKFMYFIENNKFSDFLECKNYTPKVRRPCSSCKKEMVAGPFPKWVCLRENCDMRFKHQN